MTDKEMAEEYANKNVPVDTFGYRSLDDVHYDVKQAFMTGLAEGRKEKWHDLRKAPNDLPKSSIFHEVLNQNGIKIYYDDVLKKWNMYFNGEIIQAQTPIAWCEIPKFEE